MKGLTWNSLKKEPALMPLFVMIGAACVGCAGYCLRLALKNPDVQWINRGKIPQQEYESKQYKFMTNLDYSKIQSQAPKYEE